MTGLALIRRKSRYVAWMLLPIPLALAGCGDAEPEAVQETADGAMRTMAPVEQPSVGIALRRLAEFTKLRRALAATGVAPRLTAREPLTLLAPRDNAIVQLGPEGQAALFDPANLAALTAQLRNMIIARSVRAEELKTLIDEGGGTARLASISGATISFTREGDQLVATWPNGARATMGTQEVSTGNGVFYVIDHWPG